MEYQNNFNTILLRSPKKNKETHSSIDHSPILLKLPDQDQLILSRNIFGAQDVPQNFPIVKQWTLRDINLILADNPEDLPYGKEDYYSFFQTILNFPDIHPQNNKWKTQLVTSGENKLELWQNNARFDLVYYHRERLSDFSSGKSTIKFVRQLSVNLRKPQIYIPETLDDHNFPIPYVKLKTYPLKDEFHASFGSLCVFLCDQIDKFRR
jgi:hypothetical protein